MMSILHDKAHPAKACNVTVIDLEQAPTGYRDFDKGAAKKFVSTRMGCGVRRISSPSPATSSRNTRFLRVPTQ